MTNMQSNKDCVAFYCAKCAAKYVGFVTKRLIDGLKAKSDVK